MRGCVEPIQDVDVVERLNQLFLSIIDNLLTTESVAGLLCISGTVIPGCIVTQLVVCRFLHSELMDVSPTNCIYRHAVYTFDIR